MAEKKTYLLRIRRDVWDEIERMAADEFRSINAQIEYLLAEAARKRRRSLPPDASDGEEDSSGPR